MADQPASVGGPTPTPPPPATIGFQRAHKSALGFAFGLIAAMILFAITAIHVLAFTPEERLTQGLPLYLIAQYFAGYTVTWEGALIGAAWGFAVGFIAGWLLGFVHNFTIGVWLLFIRAKRDLRQTRHFLDQI
jgi:hypothetical protein